MPIERALPSPDEMYAALVAGDASYDGVFITAVKTTGIFCRPTCTAKKPRRANVEFFAAPREALEAGYRACLRCRPLEPRGAAPEWLRPLLAAIEQDPSRRFSDDDLRGRDLEPTRVRRWFQREHGMTFHAYLRARRMGLARGRLRKGEDLTMVAYDHGYESLSGFREAFGRIYGDAPGRTRDLPHVLVTRLLTPVGPLIAGATDEGIRMLQFGEQERLESQLRASSRRIGGTFVPGTNAMLERLDVELKEYFDGRRTEFEVPLILDGTEFQKAAWQSLIAIPYGETRSYAEQARSIGRPKAVRAVGRANGDNHIAIVIPCHRVVGADGRLTGYGGGLWRKQALLEHERRVSAHGPSVFRVAQSQLSDRSCG